MDVIMGDVIILDTSNMAVRGKIPLETKYVLSALWKMKMWLGEINSRGSGKGGPGGGARDDKWARVARDTGEWAHLVTPPPDNYQVLNTRPQAWLLQDTYM